MNIDFDSAEGAVDGSSPIRSDDFTSAASVVNAPPANPAIAPVTNLRRSLDGVMICFRVLRT